MAHHYRGRPNEEEQRYNTGEKRKSLWEIWQQSAGMSGISVNLNGIGVVAVHCPTGGVLVVIAIPDGSTLTAWVLLENVKSCLDDVDAAYSDAERQNG